MRRDGDADRRSPVHVADNTVLGLAPVLHDLDEERLELVDILTSRAQLAPDGLQVLRELLSLGATSFCPLNLPPFRRSPRLKVGDRVVERTNLRLDGSDVVVEGGGT